MLNVKDVNLIHWATPMPCAPATIPTPRSSTTCATEGILVMDETPAVGIGGGAAVNPYKEYPLAEHHRQVLAR